MEQYECNICGASFETVRQLKNHFSIHQDENKEAEYDPSNEAEDDDDPLMQKASGNALKVITFHPEGQEKVDPLQLFSNRKEDITKYLKDATKGKSGMKWHMSCAIKFVKYDKEGNEIDTVAFFTSKCVTKLPQEDEETLNLSIDQAYYKMIVDCQEFQREGSGWAIDEVLYLKLMMAKYVPLKGSQYIDLPPKVKNSKAVINIQNDDDKCFLWLLLAYLYEANDHRERVNHYKQYESELNMNGITYPVPKFEKQNDISVNVFEYENGYYPLYISRNQKEKHVNLLLIEKGGKTHYCLITDLNKMLHSQTNHQHKTFYCTYCLHGFMRKDLLDKHKPLCEKHGAQCTELPSGKDKFMTFKNWGKMLKVPFVIYADFECILSPLQNGKNKTHLHEPCGYSYLVVSALEEVQREVVCYRGDNVVEHFFDDMIKESDYLLQHLKTNIPMIFTEEDEQVHGATNACFICQEHMSPNDKVRDHCHFTGKYRGAAHFKCNLAFKHPKTFPVFFHNLEGYDSHLLMQHLGKYKRMKLSCIPTNSEKYISFNLGHLQFLDSLNFMNESLGKLVDNLAAEGDQHFHHIKRHFTDSEERKLLLRKGVYPYEWMDHADKMEYTSLPEKEAFDSKLSLSSISDDDYTHAKNVWKTFHMQTMGDYHDLYLKTDVLLLVDVFENFRKKCLEYYALDPAHYYTAPGLSWDAALKMTKVNLELLDDIEMHLMVEKGNNNFSTVASIIISANTMHSKCALSISGVRGGVSTISTRYCKANNMLMQYYDEKKNIIYILDLDANNLYGKQHKIL